MVPSAAGGVAGGAGEGATGSGRAAGYVEAGREVGGEGLEPLREERTYVNTAEGKTLDWRDELTGRRARGRSEGSGEGEGGIEKFLRRQLIQAAIGTKSSA